MILKVWEVYEDDTNRCLIFGREEEARTQMILGRVDRIVQSNVSMSDEEIQQLVSGEPVWCD